MPIQDGEVLLLLLLLLLLPGAANVASDSTDSISSNALGCKPPS
jgi:hypothetical protein